MIKLRWRRLVWVLLFVIGVGGLAAAQSQKSEARADLMRQKLDFAKGMLEGLTREDYPQIAKNAKALKALSQAAVWTDTKLRSKPEYGWLSVEFQQLADEIATKADQKNLDGATLGYVQLAANCVRCHRNVRDMKK